MSFAERQGFVEVKPLQIDSMDTSLNSRLFNAIHQYNEKSPNIAEELRFVVDKLGMRLGGNEYENWNLVNAVLNPAYGNPWYMAYEVIECFFAAKKHHCQYCQSYPHKNCGDCRENAWIEFYPKIINRILEEEKSGYRLVDGTFVNIVDKTELSTISDASNSPFNSVNTHIKKALALYSDRKNPDRILSKNQ